MSTEADIGTTALSATDAQAALQALCQPPFSLDAEGLRWVQSRLASLSLDGRLRQLFVLALIGDDLSAAAAVASFAPGGVVRAPGADPCTAWQATQRACAGASIPLLVAADLEGGSNHPSCLAAAPNALMLAAADDPELTAEVTDHMAREARRQGFNWALGPVLDPSVCFRSAIVGTRSFGAETERIGRHAAAQMRALQHAGLAATLKHWPGDGHDDRDQHLAPSLNPLTMDDWFQSHGELYRRLIQAGALAVMAGHIALPAWAASNGRDDPSDGLQPASASAALNLGLLRDRLGFNGLIVSDALPMAGFAAMVPDQDRAVVALSAGCDMLLFSPAPDQDLACLHAAVADGRLSRGRVDAAAQRVLGMKAALGLHREPSPVTTTLWTTEPPDTSAARQTIYRRAADAAITLVKDRHGLLPLNPTRHPRVLVLEQAPKALWPGQAVARADAFMQALTERGFTPRRLSPGESLTEALAGSDLLVYVLMQESALTVGRISIDWDQLHGGFPHSMARPWHDRPVLMVSFGHPYHLYDAPTMPCHVNAYAATREAQEAVAARLVGDAAFSGRSPVDPFCGLMQTRR